MSFGSLKLTKNADLDKCKYSGIGFDSRSESLFTDRNFEKMSLFWSWSAYIDNKYKDILILGEGPTQRLHDTTLTAETKDSMNITQSEQRFVLSLQYNGSNFYLLLLQKYISSK